MEFLWFLLIGLAAGWLAGQITKGGSFGIVNNMIIGVIGAILGGVLLRVLGFQQARAFPAELVTATVGALVLLFLLKKLAKK